MSKDLKQRVLGSSSKRERSWIQAPSKGGLKTLILDLFVESFQAQHSLGFPINFPESQTRIFKKKKIVNGGRSTKVGEGVEMVSLEMQQPEKQ